MIESHRVGIELGTSQLPCGAFFSFTVKSPRFQGEGVVDYCASCGGLDVRKYENCFQLMHRQRMLGGLIVLLRESFCRSAFGQCELMSGTFVIENRRVWKLELASQLPFVTIFGLRITLERFKVMVLFIVVHHVEAEDISKYKKTAFS